MFQLIAQQPDRVYQLINAQEEPLRLILLRVEEEVRRHFFHWYKERHRGDPIVAIHLAMVPWWVRHGIAQPGTCVLSYPVVLLEYARKRDEGLGEFWICFGSTGHDMRRCAWSPVRLGRTAAWSSRRARVSRLTRVPSVARMPGISRRKVKETRHIFATLALIDNVHPKKVQEALSHSSIAITLDTYSHLVRTLSANSMRNLDRLFS